MQPVQRHPPALVLVWPADPFWRGLQAVLAALCFSALLLWGHEHLTGLAPLSWAVALLLAGVTLLAAWLCWRHGARPPWRLRWDGQTWHLQCAERAPECVVQLDMAMDWGDWLLLRWRPTEPSSQFALWNRRWRYGALHAVTAGAQWHGLRVALYCRAP